MDEQLHDDRRAPRPGRPGTREVGLEAGRATFSTSRVLPVLGLSAATVAAIFVGGALGTVCRYLLEAHSHVAPGRFPWVTLLVNLSGSFAIGLLVPLTEHVSHRPPPCGRSSSSASSGAGRPTPRWPSKPPSWPSTVTSPPAWPTSPPPSPAAWRSSSRAMRLGRQARRRVSTSAPTLGLALLVALAGGVGAVARAPCSIHHLGLRGRLDPLPVGTIVVNASGSLVLGVLTGLSLYHGLGPHVLAVAGVGLCGGYTTWSTASWETVHLLRSGHRAAGRRLHGGRAGRSASAAAAAGIGLMALV